LQALQERHPSVGAVRSIGLFGIVELVRSRRTREPLAPFGGTSPQMAELGRFFREEGLYTFVRWNTFFTNPPLCITDAELRAGFAITGAAVEKRAGTIGRRGATPKPRAFVLKPSPRVGRVLSAPPPAGSERTRPTYDRGFGTVCRDSRVGAVSR